MTMRNPQNDRYTRDPEDRKGVTRKSAASAKPKSKAASSVVVREVKNGSKKKPVTKAEKKQRDQERRQQENRFYHPPTKKYVTWHRIWLIAIVVALAAIIIPIVMGSQTELGMGFYVVIGIAYAAIIFALFTDMSTLRRERKRYAAAMADKKSPEYKAAAKQAEEQEAKIKEGVKAVREEARAKGEAEGKTLNEINTAMHYAEEEYRKKAEKQSRNWLQRNGFAL